MRTFRTGPSEAPCRYVVDAEGQPIAEGGEGAEGPVFRARIDDPQHRLHGTDVALKLLAHDDPTSFGLVASRLAAAASGADGRPGLMQPIECFLGTSLLETAGDAADRDVCWVASQWVTGTRLSEYAQSADPDERLEVVAQAAEALQHLHDARTPEAPSGVVHRDVKTSNIRVRPDGTAVLIDFGLARPVADETTLVGTPRWIAPEVLGGRSAGPWSDAWGVGAVAHDLLVGEPPALDGAGASRERMAQALRQLGHPHAAAVAAHLATLLATDPSERPPNLTRWAAGLRDAQQGRSASRPSPRQLLIVAGALALVAAIGAGIASFRSPSPPRQPTETGAAAGNEGDKQDDKQDDKDSSAAPDGENVNAERSTPTSATTTTTPYRCERQPMLPDSPAAQRVTELYLTTDACAGPPEAFADAVALRLKTADGILDGVVMAGPTQPAVRLAEAQYTSYREIAGRADVNNAVRFGGYPTEVVNRRDHWIVELDRGGLIAGARRDTQGFWIPGEARAVWEGTGGIDGQLGLPTSNTFFQDAQWMLEFERGYLRAPLSTTTVSPNGLPLDPTTIEAVVLDEPGEVLDQFGDLEGRVLRQRGGQAWIVEDGKRHWIGDIGTWGCVEAERRRINMDIPGYAVASVPLGAPAKCNR